VGDHAATTEAFAGIALATGGEAKKFNADELLDVVCIQALEQVRISHVIILLNFTSVCAYWEERCFPINLNFG
jgi:hypothetical protein